MRRRLPYILFSLFLAGIIASCEKVIEFEGEALEKKLVMYSMLNPDSVIDVYISYSHPIFDHSFSYAQLPNANVSLFRDDTFIETLTYRSPFSVSEYGPAPSLSNYVSVSEIPVPGSTYRLEVSVPGYQSISSEAVLPTPVPIISLDTATISYTESDFDFTWVRSAWKATIRFRDPPDEENYYRLVLRHIYGSYTGDKSLPYSNEYPVVVADEEILWIQSDDPLLNPEEDNSIFGSNIPNSFSVFSDELISGKEYELDFTIDPYYFTIDTAYHEFFQLQIGLQAITKDLYLYLVTYTAQDMLGNDLFSEPVIIHSNVNEGLGIFGAAASSNRSITQGSYPDEGVYYLKATEFYDYWDY